jgi:hypothetical protein
VQYEKPDLLMPTGSKNDVRPIDGNGNCIVCGGVAL